MAHRPTPLRLIPAALVLLAVGGCIRASSSGGAAIPLSPSGTTDDGGGAQPGGGGGTGEGGGTAGGDVGTGGDEPLPGNEGDFGTDGADIATDGGATTNSSGDADQDDPEGPDQGPTGATPTVMLSVTDWDVSPNDLIFLTCLVIDAGSSAPFEFEFVSSTGGGEITPVSTDTASALVPPGLQFINYQCRGTNSAGAGELSDIVMVTVTGG